MMADETKPRVTLVDFETAIKNQARHALGREFDDLTKGEMLLAACLATRDFLLDGMLDTEKRHAQSGAKRLYYLSMEFLVGRSLGNNLSNLALQDRCRDLLAEIGYDLEEIEEEELDAALGNGGLGRLAACFLDSLATLGMPGYGYGINFEYGLFKQRIENGHQREEPDDWRPAGSPWLIPRPGEKCTIPVYGKIEADESGKTEWVEYKTLAGIPWDMPIAGFGGHTVNYLRLFSAASAGALDMDAFSRGDYLNAFSQEIQAEIISAILYPSDSEEAGRELRLLQEYFLVACAIRDIMSRYRRTEKDLANFAADVAIQLNDTHPALAVAELMRALLDDFNLDWPEAWEQTRQTIAYTNHTLLPEALERWPVALLERVVPRHLEIITAINEQFILEVQAARPGDPELTNRMSIIEGGDFPNVRMGNLAIVGSHSVNGVSAIHSELIQTSLVPDFYQLWPERFNNKTNGVTQRRWLLQANPDLAALITETIGDRWTTDLSALRELEGYAEDARFHADFRGAKQRNKDRLAAVIEEMTTVRVDPASLFDVQIKRIHEYKRQLLSVLYIIHQYLCLVEDGLTVMTPRTHIFAGKAAQGYWAAKQTIKLINNVGRVINSDPRVRDMIKVVFLPDYRVSLAEKIIPAADLSEQISTAGKEASGTGNMKLSMNGALTICTLDGANIEIRDEVGPENIYLFGLRAEQIQELHESGGYEPGALYENSRSIRRVIDSLLSDQFCPDEPGLFEGLANSLIESDYYLHLADFASYVEAQSAVSTDFGDPFCWTRKAILNVARMGKFSSDRTVLEYAREIWGIQGTWEAAPGRS